MVSTAARSPTCPPPQAESDFYFVPADDPETAVARILELVQTRIPRRFGLDPVRDIQVLCPMNRGGCGARSLNIALQAALNPATDNRVERFGWTFATGEKVMQIENDYERDVYNGDIGFVTGIDRESSEMTVEFDGKVASFGFGELDALVPAYAATIHKSQGSEYAAVVIPVMTQHYVMLQRNLLYTGVTRGKQLVVLVGQPRCHCDRDSQCLGASPNLEVARMAGRRGTGRYPASRTDCRHHAWARDTSRRTRSSTSWFDRRVEMDFLVRVSGSRQPVCRLSAIISSTRSSIVPVVTNLCTRTLRF